jgi:signal transduction histidine kinase
VNQLLEIALFIGIGLITGFLVESDYKKKKILELQIKRLTDLENYTQNILDSITNVMIAVNTDFIVQSVNKEGKQMFEDIGSLENKNIIKLFKESQSLENLLKEVIEQNKKISNKELQLELVTDQEFYVRLTAYPLYNILNHIEGVVIVLEDISKIRELESQMRRAEKLSAVGELASGVAHEIRNPLGIIKTIAQTLREDYTDEKFKEAVDIIIHEIDRANTVIKGILNFAKPNIQEKREHSINQVIEEVLILTKKYVQNNNVTIEYEKIVDKTLYVDSDQLKQAFINIIFNAVQSIEGQGKIYITLETENNYVVIGFKDTGKGIESKKLEKIFEPFYTTKNSGTGLGMSITHRIIEDHNGYMEVASELNKGTTISIYLPFIERGANE